MKKAFSRALALVLTMVLLVSAVPFAAATEGEESVTLSESELTLYPLEHKALSAKTTPSGKTVTWSSDDEEVATVSRGRVTAKAPGNATITATVKEGVTATCEVTVEPFPVNMDSSLSMDKGDTETLEVSVDGLTKGKDFKVTWDSEDDKIATVNNKGEVTAKRVGNVEITAKISGLDDYKKEYFEETTLTCDVEVTDDTRISVPEEVSVAVGSTKKISAELIGGDTKYSKEEFSFEIDDEDIAAETKNSATDTSITIKGKTPGMTTVTVTLEEAEDEDDNAVTAEDEVIKVYVYDEVDIEVVLQEDVDKFDFDEDDIFEEVYVDGDEMDDPEDWTLSDMLFEIVGTGSSRYVTFEYSTSSSSSGKLYIDPDRTSTVNDDAISINSLQYVEFTMGKNASEKIGYTVTAGDSDEKIAYGVITVRSIGGGDIVYETEEGQGGAFDEEDFKDFWDLVSESSSEELDYVKFTKIPTAGAVNGTLYTNSDKLTKVTTAMKFEADYVSGSANKDLDAIYYMPGTNTDTVEYEFTAYGTKGNDYDGTVVIIVGGEKGDIVYKMDKKDDNVIFDEEDFIDFWEDNRDDDDEELEYVVFDEDPTSGTLYVDKSEDDEVDDEMEFYTSDFAGSKDYELDDVCYVPAKTPKSAVIEFTAYGEDGEEESGTVYIQYGDETEASDTITSRGVVFGKNGIDDEIADLYEDETDGELEYVTFELPSASDGKLYYSFDKILTTDKVDEKDEFYVEPSSKQLDLEKVCFIPAAGKTGKVKIEFTAYGNEDEMEGEITLNISAKTASAKFTDVNSKSYSWAADSVDFLYYEGVVNGTNTANTLYSPANSITRGHFMLMIYRAFLENDHGTDSVTSNFSDIKKGTSDYEKELYQAVGVAKKLGIAKGSGDKFNPNSKITREEAMTLVYRTLQELDMDLEYSTSKTSSSFNDSSKVSSWASDSISYLIKHGVIVGSGGNINPKSNITRAEMAVILHRVLTY